MNADALSRLPAWEKDYKHQISSDDFKAISCLQIGMPFVESLCLSTTLDIDFAEDADIVAECRETRQQQAEDKNISLVLEMLRKKVTPILKKYKPGTELYQLIKDYEKLKIKRGLLGRVTFVDGVETWRVVLPRSMRAHVLEALHDQAGHQCRDRTLSFVKDRCWWPGMWSDVDRKVKQCERCIKRKTTTNVRAPLVNITTSMPMELVCIDFVTLE